MIQGFVACGVSSCGKSPKTNFKALLTDGESVECSVLSKVERFSLERDVEEGKPKLDINISHSVKAENETIFIQFRTRGPFNFQVLFSVLLLLA